MTDFRDHEGIGTGQKDSRHKEENNPKINKQQQQQKTERTYKAPLSSPEVVEYSWRSKSGTVTANKDRG